MIDNVYNRNDLLINNNVVRQNQEMTGVDRRLVRQNPYQTSKESFDVKDISDVAKQLYDKDKTIQKYKQMVTDMSQTEADTKVNDLISSGNLQINNDDDASSMLEDSDLISMLFN